MTGVLRGSRMDVLIGLVLLLSAMVPSPTLSLGIHVALKKPMNKNKRHAKIGLLRQV